MTEDTKRALEILAPIADELRIEMKATGKAIFGSGYLISEKAAAEKAAATRWPLSEREIDIIKALSGINPYQE